MINLIMLVLWEEFSGKVLWILKALERCMQVLMDRSGGRLEDKCAKRNIDSSVPAHEVSVCVLRTRARLK